MSILLVTYLYILGHCHKGRQRRCGSHLLFVMQLPHMGKRHWHHRRISSSNSSRLTRPTRGSLSLLSVSFVRSFFSSTLTSPR